MANETTPKGAPKHGKPTKRRDTVRQPAASTAKTPRKAAAAKPNATRAHVRTAAAPRPKKPKQKLALPGIPVGKLWSQASKQAKRSARTSKKSPVKLFFKTLLVFVILLLQATGKNVGALLKQSHAAQAALVALVLVVGLGVCDAAANSGRAYAGVKVGSLDVAGKNADEIAAMVDEEYGTKVDEGSVVIFASEEAQNTVDADVATAQDAALAEQLAVDEARANKQAWMVAAEDVGASVPVERIAENALAVGRENGGLLARMQAMVGGWDVDVDVDYNQTFVDALALDIDGAIGEVREDFDVEVVNGTASVTPGHTGEMVNIDAFKDRLTEAFFSGGGPENSFVAQVEHAPLRIDEAQAQAVADQVNAAIANGARFEYDGSGWDATPADLGAWISTAVEPNGDDWTLEAYVDAKKAKPSLLSHMEGEDDVPVSVSFEVNGDDVTVHTADVAAIPLVADAASALQERLFGDAAGEGGDVVINVEQGTAPTTLSLAEAIDLGIVGTISSFTTEFTTGTGTENRNHNIELVSKLLNNSVTPPGEVWSFNETAGDCNEEAGFEEAGAIVGGEYVDSTGGGICQVATTVFNAVYEAGLPVVSRSNHSLYISSYPPGRDAAVSWPDLDLKWENDTDSDILLAMECVDGAVTATLYGVDPEYTVTSETGAWEEGEKYETIEEVDETLAEGTSYVKTAGADGSEISVTRTVTDKDGAVVRQDLFASVYSPIDEVVVKGPNTVIDNGGDASTWTADASTGYASDYSDGFYDTTYQQASTDGFAASGAVQAAL